MRLIDLAAASGVEARRLQRIETIAATVTPKEIYAISRAMGAPVSSFFARRPSSRDRDGVIPDRRSQAEALKRISAETTDPNMRSLLKELTALVKDR